MSAISRIVLFSTLWGALGVTANCIAADSPRIVNGASQPAEKFAFILFWNEDDENTQRMAAELKASSAVQSKRATWSNVNLKDQTNRSIVERFQVGRAPMPLVLCVAPNGAVTAAMTDEVTDELVESALVTPAMAECMKALQDNKLVIVHVKRDAELALPKGAVRFAADPLFRDRTAVVELLVDDAEETRFLAEMEIDPQLVTTSVLAILAPPGGLAGKFSASATKEQIAAELHGAGKCCADPKCKHNKKGK